MNEDRDREDDSLADLLITNWEQQCIEHLEREPDYEGHLVNARDLATQKVWVCFQNTAASIAQLYKGIHEISRIKCSQNCCSEYVGVFLEL